MASRWKERICKKNADFAQVAYAQVSNSHLKTNVEGLICCVYKSLAILHLATLK